MSAFAGMELSLCPKQAFDFTRGSSCVVVSGATWNKCGHALLNLGGCSGWYFHVAGMNTAPRYMGEAGYQRYLREEGKHEIRRWKLQLPNPDGAKSKLLELAAKPWLWLVLPHNCVDFVEEIAFAGGGKTQMRLNCPTYGRM